jgi:hypothetical protein
MDEIPVNTKENTTSNGGYLKNLLLLEENMV